MEDLIKVNESVLSKLDKKKAANCFLTFLDMMATATGRATHYETKREQEEAVAKIHDELYKIDRSIYGLTLLLPGATDYTLQYGLKKFLSNPVKDSTFLTEEQEFKLLNNFLDSIENQRVLKSFIDLTDSKVNNSRQRRLILRTLLNYENLEWWSVKYRKKVATSLSHAWGTKMTSIICNILSKKRKSKKDMEILKKNLDKYVDHSKDIKKIYECVTFVFRKLENPKLNLFKAYYEARKDLKAGSCLPKEVLEGIRGVYHPTVPKEKILELTAKTMTVKQKKLVQKKAKEAGIEIGFDPKNYSPEELYIYAYETGMTKEIQEALEEKAQKSASDLPFSYNKIGVLVDTSYSMRGDDTQKNRPISISLAVRDMLFNLAKEAKIVYSHKREVENYDIVEPKDDTSLVEELFELVKEDGIEAVFVLSHGYENAPAGKFDQVVRIMEKIGINVPIYQMSSTFSAKSAAKGGSGVKKLSEKVATLPVSKASGMAIAMIKSMMLEDPSRGIQGLLNLGVKKLK